MSGSKQITCSICGQVKTHAAKGLCITCYKRVGVPNVICKNCKRIGLHHAQQLCKSCYAQKYYRQDPEVIKRANVQRWYNLNYELWKEITKKCIICGFDNIVDLHHLDQNRDNSSRENLVGLCPNHHRMIHTSKYSEEIKEEIRKKIK